MSSSENPDLLSREELLALVAELQRQVAQLAGTVDELRAQNAQLQRGAKRQGAPSPGEPGPASPSAPAARPGKAPILLANLLGMGLGEEVT